MDTDIVGIVAGLGFFLLLFAFIILMRYLSYRETLALAEKGLVRPVGRGGNGSGKDTLRWGISLTAIGLALCISLYPIGLLPGMKFPLGLGPWMMVGFLPTFFGLGLVLIYVITHDKSDEADKPNQINEPKQPPM
jgi:uncharacterized protein DUF6249